MSVNLTLPWPPSINRCYRTYKGRYLLSSVGRQYKQECANELMLQRAPKGMTERLDVLIDAFPPDRRKRDLDNLLKPTLDALEGYGMFDDSQIDDLRIRRRETGWPSATGYLRVRIMAA